MQAHSPEVANVHSVDGVPSNQNLFLNTIMGGGGATPDGGDRPGLKIRIRIEVVMPAYFH